MSKNYSNKKHVRILAFIGLVLICIATIGFGVVTTSKYVLEWDDRQVAVPENFYFESNYLQYAEKEEDIPRYTIYTDSIEFNVRNHNNIDINSDKIAYQISWEQIEKPEDSTEDRAILTDKDGKTLDSNSLETFYLEQIETKQEVPFTVSYEKGDSTEETVSIKVTVTSTSPYSKEISAIFDFKNAQKNSFYRITNKGYYMLLELFTGSAITAETVITIDYTDTTDTTDNLAPDNTNDFMSDWTTVDGQADLQGLSPNGYYQFVFFKANVGLNTLGDQLLSESDGSYTIKISE